MPRFEVLTLEMVPLHPPARCSHVLIVEEQQVRCTLGTVNPRKAADPDSVCVQVLKDCAAQSLSQALHTLCPIWSSRGAAPGGVDFSSAFNTILPSRFVSDLLGLGLSDSVCHWIKVFFYRSFSEGESRPPYLPSHQCTTLHSLHTTAPPLNPTTTSYSSFVCGQYHRGGAHLRQG